MEEALIIILQVVFELAVQLLLYGGLDLTSLWFGRDEKPGGVGCLMMFVFALIGATFGGLANLIHPGTLLPYAWLRIANLVLGPLLAGRASWWLTDWRRRHGARLVPNMHFWFAFWFVLVFDLVRFIYGQH